MFIFPFQHLFAVTLGGTEASFQTADFIFSEDANAPDTVR